jgi:hypothetical protein
VGTVNLEGFYTVGAAFLVLFGEKAHGVIPNARVLTSGRRDLAWTILAEETGLMR